MRSVGIDIGSFSVKVVEIEASTTKYQLKDSYEIAIPQDPTTDVYLHTLEILRKIANHYDPTDTKFIVGLRQENVLSRHVHFPFKQKNKIEKSVAFELEDDLPFDTDNAVIHSKILATGPNYADVLALTSPKEPIRKMIELCNEAGFDPEIISAEGSALSNLFEKWQRAPLEIRDDQMPVIANDSAKAVEEVSSPYKKAQLVISIGHTKTLIAINDEDRLISVRSIQFGGKDIAMAISKKYNVTYLEALKTLQEKGFILTDQKQANQDQVTFSNTISASLDVMITDIKRHLLSLEAQLHIKITQAYVTGGTSRLLNLCQYLTQCLFVAVNPLKNMTVLKDSEIVLPKDNYSRYSIALGLSIEGLRQHKNPPVNFRRLEFAPKSQSREVFMTKWAFAMKCAATLLVFLFVYTFTKTIITANLASATSAKLRAQATKVGLKGRAATTERIAQYIKQQRSEIRKKEELSKMQNFNSSLDIVLDLTKAMPSKDRIQLDVRRLQVDHFRMIVEGHVSNPSQVELVKQSLMSLAPNKKIEPLAPSISQAEGKTSFSYQIAIDRNIGAF